LKTRKREGEENMSAYLIPIILALLIVVLLLVLRFTRKKLDDMDGLGKVTEPGEDDDVIGTFGK
jgi:hypothetical protein